MINELIGTYAFIALLGSIELLCSINLFILFDVIICYMTYVKLEYLTRMIFLLYNSYLINYSDILLY